MTDEMHPAVAGVLRQAHALQSIMDAQLQKMATDTFTGADESRTAQVTLDGHHQLTGVHLADGLLRQDVRTVEARVNEALQNATAAATAAIEADRERIDALVAELSDRQD